MQYPKVPLKQMDSAMLNFELLREIEKLEESDREMVSSAAMLATHLHRNQTRKARGNKPRTPYIEHPLRNTLRLIRWGYSNSSLFAISLLHDTVEDCIPELADFFDWDHNEFDEHQNREKAFEHLSEAYSSRVASGVEEVTNPVEGDYHEHLKRLMNEGAPSSILVKISDLIDNAASLPHQFGSVPSSFVTKRVPKYHRAIEIMIRGVSGLNGYWSFQVEDDLCKAREVLIQLSEDLR